MSPPRPPEAGTLKASHAWEPGLLPKDLFAGPRREAYDALADLFLGDSEAESFRPPLAPLAAPARSSPPLRLVPGGPVRDRDTSSAAEHIEPPTPTSVPDPGPPRLEALLVGHLPILASAWVMQYARHVAEQLAGPVAVLRLRPGSGILELAGLGSSRLAEDVGRPATLRDVVGVLARPGGVRAWLIRVDQVAEPSLVSAKGLDALTILAGVDEAATVAAYTSIKHVPGSGTAGLTPVRLALMGGTPERAQSSSSKVARAAEEFLGRRVEVAACVQRIAGGRTELAWSGSTGESIESTLAWLCPLIKEPIPARQSGAPRHPAPTPAPKSRQPEPTPAPSDPPPAMSPPEEPASVARPATVIAPGTDVLVPARANRSGRLSRHLPGLSSLSATCPYAPCVELAAGADGVLHLLALDGAGPDPAALPALTTAAAWVRCHLSLLRPAAAAEGCMLADVDPILHLLTTSAPTVRRLGDSGIRLHVLASTRAGNELVWACADLN